MSKESKDQSNSEFIEGARALLRQGANNEQWEFATLLRKACDRLDASESINAELLEELKMIISLLCHLGSFVTSHDISRADALIAKTEKENE